MKNIKMLGLAAVAAMSLMAFVGVSAASATAVCTSAPTGAPLVCPTGTVYTGGTMSTALSSATAHFASGFINIDCNQSNTAGTLPNPATAGAGNVLTGSLTAITFQQNGSNNCPTNLSGVTCASSVTVPVNVSAKYVQTTNPEGRLYFIPAVSISCSNGTSCSYTGNNAAGDGANTLSGDLHNSAHTLTYPSAADTVANLKKTGGSFACSSTATYTATYNVTGAGGVNLFIADQ